MRRTGCQAPDKREPEQPKRVVLVVGVVEERDAVGIAEGGDDLTADRSWPSIARIGPDGRVCAAADGGRQSAVARSMSPPGESWGGATAMGQAPGLRRQASDPSDRGGLICRTTGCLSSWVLPSKSSGRGTEPTPGLTADTRGCLDTR